MPSLASSRSYIHGGSDKALKVTIRNQLSAQLGLHGTDVISTVKRAFRSVCCRRVSLTSSTLSDLKFLVFLRQIFGTRFYKFDGSRKLSSVHFG